MIRPDPSGSRTGRGSVASACWRWLPFVGLTGVLIALAVLVPASGGATSEIAFARWLQSIHLPGWTALIDITEWLTRTTVVRIIAVTAILTFFMSGRRHAAAAVALALLVLLPEFVIEQAVARDRPTPDAVAVVTPGSGYAFPSGHITGALAIYGTLAVLLCRRLPARGPRVAVVALAALVIGGSALGRIILGAHWATDVAGALLLSGAWLLVVARGSTALARRGLVRIAP